MNQLKHHRYFERAAWGVVLLVLVNLCWWQSQPESELRWFCTAIKPSADHSAAPNELSSRIVQQASRGNVLLKLAGYARTNSAVENSLAYVYYRTTYDLYPRRLYVAPADQIINNGRDIMRAEFNPDRQWLQQHDIRSVLIFGNDHPGGEASHLELLPPDEEGGIQVNPPGGNR